MEIYSSTTVVFSAPPKDTYVVTFVPDKEKPILDKLYQFRHSLHQLKKDSGCNFTLPEVNQKASEINEIYRELQHIRNAYDFDQDVVSSNRVDDVLDTIWMQLFFMWSRIAGIDETLYPTYVSLVTLVRSANALRQSAAWTASDLESLEARLRTLDETVAVSEGKFVVYPFDQGHKPLGDKIPCGQAVLASLLARAHRIITFMRNDGESIREDLMPVKLELEGMLKQLTEFQEKGVGSYSASSLAPISKRLHAIDLSRTINGNFFNSDAATGHATIAGIMNSCFDKLNLLVADLDPVLSTSPLHSTYRALLDIHSELVRISGNSFLRSKPVELSVALEVVQEKLGSLESKRVNGTFVPPGETFDTAVKDAGQATMHKLLHDCHALITRLVDPVSLPVGEALVSTYELLLKQRTVLRKLRAWSTAGWNVSKELKEVEEVLKTVESSRVKGLFVSAPAQVAESADSRASYAEEQYSIPDGQATISALVDECDSLVWQISCTLSQL